MLENDFDADGDRLRVDRTGIQTRTSHVVADPNGTTITYSPNANFAGIDMFTYLLMDGRGGYAYGTVTVTVTPAHEGLIAVMTW